MSRTHIGALVLLLVLPTIAATTVLEIPTGHAVREGAYATDNAGQYVFGGWRGLPSGGPITDIARWDPATGLWDVVAHLPAPVSDAVAVSVGWAYFVLGGNGPSGSRTEVYQWSPGMSTAVLVGHLAEPRLSACATIHNGVIHVVGGIRDTPLSASNYGPRATLTFNIQTYQGGSVSPTFNGHAMGCTTTDGNILHLTGGATYAGGGHWNHLKTVHRYDPATGTLTRTADLPDSRSGHTAARGGILDEEVYLFTGYTAFSPNHEIWHLDPDTGIVTATGAAAPPSSARSGAVSWFSAGTFYTTGGETPTHQNAQGTIAFTPST